LTEITFENGVFIHKNIMSFVTPEGEEKYYTLSLGKEWNGGEVYEDFIK